MLRVQVQVLCSLGELKAGASSVKRPRVCMRNCWTILRKSGCWGEPGLSGDDLIVLVKERSWRVVQTRETIQTSAVMVLGFWDG